MNELQVGRSAGSGCEPLTGQFFRDWFVARLHCNSFKNPKEEIENERRAKKSFITMRGTAKVATAMLVVCYFGQVGCEAARLSVHGMARLLVGAVTAVASYAYDLLAVIWNVM